MGLEANSTLLVAPNCEGRFVLEMAQSVSAIDDAIAHLDSILARLTSSEPAAAPAATPAVPLTKPAVVSGEPIQRAVRDGFWLELCILGVFFSPLEFVSELMKFLSSYELLSGFEYDPFYMEWH